jgi:hypothetical protein
LKWIENDRRGGGGGGMGYPSVVVKSFDITHETIILCSFSLLTLSLSLIIFCFIFGYWKRFYSINWPAAAKE